MAYADIQKPALSYRYEFGLDALEAAQACVEAHGFAVVKKVLSEGLVEELQESVRQVLDPDGALAPGESYTHTTFVEHAPALWQLLDYEPFLRVHRLFCQADELTIHRSAAILRNPGSSPLSWHSDWHGFTQGPPQNAGDVLNRGPWPSGRWLYLTGSYPEHGGLAVIEDSHVEDWAGPAGFALTPDRRSFHPRGSEPESYVGFDVPGMVPLFTDPGDMIIFAARTYHAAFSNQIDQVRLSCGLGFRPRSHRIDAPWPLSESAQAFVKALPPRHQHFVENYVGIDTDWRGQEMKG